MSDMKYTNLGQSGLRVSRICVGCMSFGDRSGKHARYQLLRFPKTMSRTIQVVHRGGRSSSDPDGML